MEKLMLIGVGIFFFVAYVVLTCWPVVLAAYVIYFID